MQTQSLLWQAFEPERIQANLPWMLGCIAGSGLLDVSDEGVSQRRSTVQVSLAPQMGLGGSRLENQACTALHVIADVTGFLPFIEYPRL